MYSINKLDLTSKTVIPVKLNIILRLKIVGYELYYHWYLATLNNWEVQVWGVIFCHMLHVQYLLQMAAVAGAHVGQSRLLLSIFLCSLMGICFLPLQPLSLPGQTKYWRITVAPKLPAFDCSCKEPVAPKARQRETKSTLTSLHFVNTLQGCTHLTSRLALLVLFSTDSLLLSPLSPTFFLRATHKQLFHFHLEALFLSPVGFWVA